jgi:hypothetical protein
MGSTLSSTWRELMPAGYDVHEYKSDLALKAWVKQVDGRKGRLQVKKLRVANQVGTPPLVSSLRVAARAVHGSVGRWGLMCADGSVRRRRGS